jgi:phosphodiesterase/alkaline phosphatase D-like protein
MYRLTPTRRDLLRWSGFGAARLLVGCGDNDPVRDPGTQLATAIVEPDSESFLVSVWAGLAKSVALEGQARDVVISSTSAIVDESARAVFSVDNLEAATSYDVSVVADTGARVLHQVRTAPRDDDDRPVRLAISADIDPASEFQTDLIDHIVAMSPELYISLGDFPYTDNGPPAETLDEYRQRHVDVRVAPHVRRLLGAAGMRAIYDDHEFRNDWDAMRAAEDPSRYAASLAAWDEFFPLRDKTVRYRAWRWGANVELFILDTRLYRSANASPDGDDKTMLGATQFAWLTDRIRNSAATFKLVLTSVPLAFGHGDDHWTTFARERDQLFDALAGVPGVLFVSGDQHWFAAHRHARGIREFQIGPLARGVIVPPPPVDGVVFRAERYNCGFIDIDRESLTFTGVGEGGELFYKETLGIEDLTPAT